MTESTSPILMAVSTKHCLNKALLWKFKLLNNDNDPSQTLFVLTVSAEHIAFLYILPK